MKTWLRAALISVTAVSAIAANGAWAAPASAQDAPAKAADDLAQPPGLTPSIDWSSPRKFTPDSGPARVSADGEAQTAALSPDDSAAVARVERYLNGLKSVRARFIQVSTNGSFAEGEVHIQRPGKMRFQYDDPHPVLLIADGLTLLYYDRELKQATFLPLWETPLWFLIREKVELSDDIEIVDVVQEAGTLAVVLEDSSSGDVGRITLSFSDKPLRLHKWEVIDGQGIATQVSLFNAEYDVPIEREVFNYDDLEIDSPNNTDHRGR